MQNIFYFLLVFLITLSGCKSNSFMTQRYTHLKRSKANSNLFTSTIEKRNNIKENTFSAETTVNKNEEASAAILLAAAPENKVSNKTGNVFFMPRKIINPFLKIAGSVTNELKNEKDSNHEQKVIGKKTLKEKVHQARGIITLAFKIVLLAIVLAILIAVIIIIALT